jgi:hypothetical protein
MIHLCEQQHNSQNWPAYNSCWITHCCDDDDNCGGMIPAAYAGGNDDDNHEEHEKDGDGNKQQVEEDSAGILADCDTNDADSIYICSAISPQCRSGAVCVFGQVDPTLIALPISWR